MSDSSTPGKADDLNKAPGQEGKEGQLEIFSFDNEITELPSKEDVSSMEFPLFTLAKKPDTSVREYSKGGKTLKVIPPVVGAANVFDKDLLIYAISHLVKAKNVSVDSSLSRTVRFDVYPFLRHTRRSTGGAAYRRVVDTLQRLRGTTIETNIRTTDQERTRGFSMIDSYEIVRSTKAGGALEVEITLSDWLYRQILAFEVLTLAPEYFTLTQSIERRLYELARKHCADQGVWKCNLKLLQEKCGSRQAKKSFMHDLRTIAEEDNLPQYRLVLDEDVDEPMAVFLNRDTKKLHLFLMKNNLIAWYEGLMASSKARSQARAAKRHSSDAE